jgi:LPXTG-motif cell wall-anchored protein
VICCVYRTSAEKVQQQAACVPGQAPRHSKEDHVKSWLDAAPTRRKRLIPGMLACLLALVCFALPASASGRQITGTFTGIGRGQQVSFVHHGKNRTEFAGALNLQLDNGPTVQTYCVQIDVSVRFNTRYATDGSIPATGAGCGIRYLVAKYPASSATTNQEAAARQMAVWVLSDGLDPNTIADAGIRDRTLALVDEARKGPCPQDRTLPATLSIEPDSAHERVGTTVAYVVRGDGMDAGKTVKVSITGPAVLADGAGQSLGSQQQDVVLDSQGIGHFWVTGTDVGASTINASLDYKLGAGVVFSPISTTKSQLMVLGAVRDFTATANAAANWSAAQPPQTPVHPNPTEKPTEEPSAPPTATLAPGQPSPTAAPGQPSPTAAPGQPSPTAAPEQPTQALSTPTPVQPSTLPTTGESGGLPIWLILAVVLLLGGGWLIRRRVL